jgi:hypothetical protein
VKPGAGPIVWSGLSEVFLTVILTVSVSPTLTLVGLISVATISAAAAWSGLARVPRSAGRTDCCVRSLVGRIM